MSYQVLARKWRPRSFTEMVGQEHVLQALVNGLDNDRLHHAYLFTGTRGVGKTTLARIIAKCLNCEKGVSSTPCGECSACVAINEGRFVDLLEVDAASRTKVEDTRELLENVQYLPTSGRYKVYLIDEVHMLSNHSFNALLKTLEEPPPHVKFLLATTDPQKLPVTILSRCLQFNLKNLNPERIAGHLKNVLEAEKIPFEEPALWFLGRAADGSMRDALSLTDQAIAHGGGKVVEADVNAMLGAIDMSAIEDICVAIAQSDASLTMSLVDRLAEHAPDYSEALAEMLSFWHRVAIAQTAPDALDHSQVGHATVLSLADSVSREDVQLFYQITLLGRRDLPYAADGRSGFEMVLLRLLAFQPVTAEASERPQPAGEGPAPVKKPEARQFPRELPRQASSGADALVSKSGSESIETQPVPEQQAQDIPPWEAIQPPPEIEQQPAAPQPEPPQSEDNVLESQPVPPAVEHSPAQEHQKAERPATPAVQSSSAVVSLSALNAENWVSVYNALPVGGLVQNTAANLVLTECEGSSLSFVMDHENSSLFEESHQERLAGVLSEYFGVSIQVSIRVGEIERETPRQYARRIKAERRQAAIDSLRNDPNVNSMVSLFGAELIEDTVNPIEPDVSGS